MKCCENVPRNGSHYIIVDGKEWSRHNDVKTAKRVRDQIIAEEIQRIRSRTLDTGRDRYYGPAVRSRDATMEPEIER